METAGTPDIDFAVSIIVDAKAVPTWADAH
jgi:hypothetical protein